MVNIREWAAPMAATGEPGLRTAEILLMRAGQPFHRHILDWELARPVEPMPKMLVIQPGTTRYRIVLRSRDTRPFRVASVTCDLASIEVEPPSSTDGVVQTVIFVEKTRTPTDKSPGKITLTTNHPAAPMIEIPVHVLP